MFLHEKYCLDLQIDDAEDFPDSDTLEMIFERALAEHLNCHYSNVLVFLSEEGASQ